MPKTYSPPRLDKKVQAAVDRGDFDFLLPFQKNLYRVNEVADTIGFSPQSVVTLIEIGKLEAHEHNIYGTGARLVRNVTRRSILLYLAETANYDPSYLVLRIEALLKPLKGPPLDRLIATLLKQRERIS